MCKTVEMAGGMEQAAAVLTLVGGGEERVQVPGGEIVDDVLFDGMFFGRTDVAGAVVLPGVTRIGVDAFWGCSSLASATIPEGVTTIG